MSTRQGTKRKSTAADPTYTKRIKRATPSKNNPVTDDRELQSTSQDAQVSIAANTITSRPWLSRPQNISEQDIWLIHCRNNLEPGATDVKDWKDVAAEFNEHFKNEQKKDLSFKTLQRRMGMAKKQFYADNPDYLHALVHRVAVSVDPDVKEDVAQENGSESASVLAQVDAPVPEEKDETRKPTKTANESQDQQPSGPGVLPGSCSPKVVALCDAQCGLAGAYRAFSVSAHHISAIDRAKYHLRRRAKDRVTFNFLDYEEQKLTEGDEQFIDHETLLMASPLYARLAHASHVRVVDVPVDFCVKTLNAFNQIISPVRAKTIPTHYLWHSQKPVPGVYDRFDAIEPEKIHWSLSYLLELHAFARHMQVDFVCDMVIDRIYWMYIEQAKLRELYGKLQKQGNWIEAEGGNKTIRFPPVSDLDSFSIAAEDIESAWLKLLTDDAIDLKSLTFFRDMIHALGGSSDTEWLEEAPRLVQDLFSQGDVHHCLTNASRSEFCAQYHHHTDAQPCYTAAAEHSPEYFVDLLYATTSHDELLTLSKHAGSPNSMSGMKHSAFSPTRDLKSANSSPEMLESEKMVLEMEMQLDLAKAALLKARMAGPEDKEHAIRLTKQVASGLRMNQDCVRDGVSHVL